MKKAVIYRRQSLDRFGTELGIDRQQEECQRLCDQRGYQVIQVITDNNRSASKGDRPGYRELMGLIESKAVDVVVVLRVDRLLRRLTELEALIELSERTGVLVATVQGDLDLTNSSGRMLGRILASVARAEVETKSERHKLANAQKARAGRPHGSPRPYGYEADLMTIKPSEAAVVREMGRRYLAGHSFKEIALWANEQGHLTSTGRPWHSITVRNLLNRKRYGGIREYDGVDYPAVWEPIFDAATWEQLQLTIRLRRDQSNFKGPIARKFLLTGLAYCGLCGGPLSGTRMYDVPDKPPRRVYFCQKRTDGHGVTTGCARIRRNADALDDFIKECVLYRLDTPQLGKLLQHGDDADTGIADLLKRRQSAKTRLDALVDDYATGLLDRDQFARAKVAAQTELDQAEQELEAMNRTRTAAGLIPVGDSVRAAWDASNSDTWRRTLLSMLIERIVVNPGITKPYYLTRDGRRYRFDPSLIDIRWRA